MKRFGRDKSAIQIAMAYVLRKGSAAPIFKLNKRPINTEVKEKVVFDLGIETAIFCQA